MRLVLLASLALSLSGGAAGQPTSTKWVSRPATPNGVQHHAMVFDRRRGVTWLYGGFNNYGPLPFYKFDGTRWTVMPWPSSLVWRYNHVMAYDVSRDRTVLFGGGFDETWEWDGGVWSQRFPANKPPKRRYGGLAYDEARQRTVLYGGQAAPYFLTPLFDTWEWDGTDWVQRFPATTPGSVLGDGMTYDSRRQKVVLLDNNSQTWEWDGIDWTAVSTPNSPTSGGQLVYHEARGRVVLARGLGGTWEYDGTDWQRIISSNEPQYRIGAATVYDARRRAILRVGGEDCGVVGCQPWPGVRELLTTEPSAVFTRGAGCSGVGLAPYRNSEPWGGETWTLALTGAASTSSTFGFLGGSETTWMGVPLPISMALLGSPSCFLHTSMDVVIPIAVGSPESTWSIAIPNQPALFGHSFYVQGLALDAVAGFSTSNSLRARVGQL